MACLLWLVPSKVDREVVEELDVQVPEEVQHLMEMVETVLPELVVLADRAVAADPE